jgi:hypothetical protein
MSDDVKLTHEQIDAVDKLARDLLIVEPQDRAAGILMMVNKYVRSVRAEYPGLPEEKIEKAASRFGDLILQRINELNNSIAGGEGHA